MKCFLSLGCCCVYCLNEVQNTVVAKPGEYGMQGVALRIAGHKAMFYKVRFVGAQDTLLDDTGTHYFYQCHIQGTVDFIFGHATSLYQVWLYLLICQYLHHYIFITSLSTYVTQYRY